MKKYIYLLIIFSVLLVIPLLQGATYGSGTYGKGLYGIGEEAGGDSSPSGGSSGGVSSSGGGSGGGIVQTIIGGFININPSEPTISVIENTEERREIIITNLRFETLSINLEIIGDELKEVLKIEEEISLAPREERILELLINIKDKKFVIGRILLRGSRFTKDIPIVISSRSDNFLFDISIVLEDTYKKITPGDKLKAQFNLLQIGVQEKVDVIARYSIQDFEGNSFYEESETFFVLKEKNFIKEFPTEDLGEGKYVLGVEITYPGAFAVSSVQFSVEERGIKFGYILTTLAIVFIIIIIIIGILFNRSSKKQIKGFLSSTKRKSKNKKI